MKRFLIVASLSVSTSGFSDVVTESHLGIVVSDRLCVEIQSIQSTEIKFQKYPLDFLSASIDFVYNCLRADQSTGQFNTTKSVLFSEPEYDLLTSSWSVDGAQIASHDNAGMVILKPEVNSHMLSEIKPDHIEFKVRLEH